MYKSILVPVDGSRTAERGLAEAIALARLCGAGLTLVHVLDQFIYAPGYSSEMLDIVREVGEKVLKEAAAQVQAAGLPVHTVLLETRNARIADLLIDQITASGADLVVMGTHGRRGISRLVMGSDAEQLLRLSPVPVLLLRGAEEIAAATVATT